MKSFLIVSLLIVAVSAGSSSKSNEKQTDVVKTVANGAVGLTNDAGAGINSAVQGITGALRQVVRTVLSDGKVVVNKVDATVANDLPALKKVACAVDTIYAHLQELLNKIICQVGGATNNVVKTGTGTVSNIVNDLDTTV